MADKQGDFEFKKVKSILAFGLRDGFGCGVELLQLGPVVGPD